MTTLADLALAFDILHPRGGQSSPFPPTTASIARINQALAIELPASLIWFAANTSACCHWLASLGDDVESARHILHLAAHTRKIRRRVIGAPGQWEYVRPAGFIPFTHGYDNDYDCFDTGAQDCATGEYPIQYWAPPRLLGQHRHAAFPQYMEACIRAWIGNAPVPIQQAILARIGDP